MLGEADSLACGGVMGSWRRQTKATQLCLSNVSSREWTAAEVGGLGDWKEGS